MCELYFSFFFFAYHSFLSYSVWKYKNRSILLFMCKYYFYLFSNFKYSSAAFALILYFFISFFFLLYLSFFLFCYISIFVLHFHFHLFCQLSSPRDLVCLYWCACNMKFCSFIIGIGIGIARINKKGKNKTKSKCALKHLENWKNKNRKQ